MQDKPSPSKRKLPTGIEARHSRSCRSRSGATCNCSPTFRAWVWDRRGQRVSKDGTVAQGVLVHKAFPTLAAAKQWRADALSAQGRGKSVAPSKRTLREAAEEWLAGAEANPPTMANRSGQPYK